MQRIIRSYRHHSRPANCMLTGTIAVLLLAPALPPVAAIAQSLRGDQKGEVATPTEYRLDTQDRVRLRIYEWRPALDQVYEWRSLNDEYTVGADGNVSVPMIGEVPARGKTTREFGRIVGEAMRQSIGVGDPPKIAVEVVTFRPFYILGTVQRPGEYSFRPNLTVLQAISVAGGMQRDEAAGTRVSRDLIANQGEIDTLRSRYRTLVARRTGVEADLANSNEIDFSRSPLDTQDPAAVAVMQQEQERYQARRADYLARLTDQYERKRFLEEELATITSQVTNQESLRSLAKDELKLVEKLIDQKLAVAPRRLAVQRNMHELDGQHLQLQAARLRLRAEIDRTTSLIEELVKGRRSESLATLGTTVEELDTVNSRLLTAQRLAAEATGLLTVSSQAGGGKPKPIYTIVRGSGDRAVQTQALEMQVLQPGDTLKVELDVVSDPRGAIVTTTSTSSGASIRPAPLATPISAPASTDLPTLPATPARAQSFPLTAPPAGAAGSPAGPEADGQKPASVIQRDGKGKAAGLRARGQSQASTLFDPLSRTANGN